MITFGRTLTKPNFLFGRLPKYFKANDTLTDTTHVNYPAGYTGEGLLERYMDIFCLEIDDKITPLIDDLPDITDATELAGLTTENGPDLTQYIAETFGNPSDIGKEDTYAGGPDSTIPYAVLLRYIRQILQTKGTVQSLDYFLAIYGYVRTNLTTTAALTNTYDLSPTPLKFDTIVKADEGFIFFSDYDLVITDTPGTGTKNPTQTWLDEYLKPAIQNFITPIWASLDSLTYA